MVREAKVFALVLKILVLGELEGCGDDGAGRGRELGNGDTGTELLSD